MIKTIYPRVFNQKALPLLLIAPFALLLCISFLGQFILAHAEGEVPALGAAVMALFGAIKDKAVTAVVLMHVFNILRTNESIGFLGKLGLQGKTLQIVIAIITTAGYVVEAMTRGSDLVAAAIEGLFTSGGAMLIFDAFKGQTKAVAVAQGEVVVATLVQKKVGKSLA